MVFLSSVSPVFAEFADDFAHVAALPGGCRCSFHSASSHVDFLKRGFSSDAMPVSPTPQLVFKAIAFCPSNPPLYELANPHLTLTLSPPIRMPTTDFIQRSLAKTMTDNGYSLSLGERVRVRAGVKTKLTFFHWPSYARPFQDPRSSRREAPETSPKPSKSASRL